MINRELQAHLKEGGEIISELGKEVQRLTVENERLKADGNRLDWLEQHAARFDNADIHYKYLLFRWMVFKDPLRAGIDDAMWKMSVINGEGKHKP